MTRLRGGEFIHVGDLCTFEVLVKSFGFKDKTVRKIAEIIHDLDIKDERYGSPEAKGLEDVLIGIRKTAKSDADALERGIAVFGRGTRYIIRRRACGRSLQGKTLRHCHGDLWHDFRYRACIRSHSRRILLAHHGYLFSFLVMSVVLVISVPLFIMTVNVERNA